MSAKFLKKIQQIRKEVGDSLREKRNLKQQPKTIDNNEKKCSRKTCEEKAKHDKNKGVEVNSLISFNLTKEKGNIAKDMLDPKLGFAHYINVINSFRNPDIMTGDTTKFLKGNKYRAELANKNEEVKNEEVKISKKDAKAENPEELDSEDDELDEPEIPSRYFHKESKGIRCKNCQEIGHMAKNCPNQSKIPMCKYCGTSHDIADVCPTQKCYKCNKTGHKAIDCNSKDVVYCTSCKKLGHKAEKCLGNPFKSSFKHTLCIVCHHPGHLNCQKNKEKGLSHCFCRRCNCRKC